MERKLASIQKILNLEPIEGADSIEKATILGWKCVVKKGQFAVGDLCVFLEVDSLIPKAEWSQFLFKGDKADKNEIRLRTVRLKKQTSQGLALSLTIIPYAGTASKLITEGEDVTDVLNIKKYEPPVSANLAGLIKGSFPAFIKKTDETRIQTVPNILERHKDKYFFMTEKIDGSSMTVYMKDGEFGVCSRNLDLKEDENNAFWKKARELDLKNKLSQIAGSFALQGELYGEGIQKNKYKVQGTHFALFNIFDIKEGKYLSYNAFIQWAYDLGLKTVPLLGEIKLNHSVDDLVKLSIGFSKINPNVQREGIVLRSVIEEQDEDLGRLSFKVINPEFLLTHGE